MKKIFIGFFALLMSASLMAERVSQEDAALVANHFMNGASSASDAQKAPQKRMVLKKAASATGNQYYIYENANGEGWVIVAANDVAHPVLAYSETGSFRTEGQPLNLKVWLEGYNRQIKRAEKDGLVAAEQVQQEWATLRKGATPRKATPVVAPLIKTGWDQDAPFWNKCPKKGGKNCYTGCVATAMAQVMNYHQWPKKGTGSHSVKVGSTTYTANFGATTYDWDNMLNTYTNSATTTQKDAVATLMYHCGIAVDMQYGTYDEGGSGAYTIDYNGYWSSNNVMCAETAFPTFFGYNPTTIKAYLRDGDSDYGLKKWSKEEWIAMLKEELDAARPIMYSGVGCEDPDDEETCYGHSFVCDGYDSNDFMHFNFGWTNSCDGYYEVDALDTDQPGNGGGKGEYSLEQDAIIGIMPAGKDVNVSWYADGVLFDETVATGGSLTLPASTPEDCQNGKVFVGWTEEDSYEGDEAPALVTEGTFLEEDATFYAVYATAEGGSGTKTVTYTGSELFSNQEAAGTKTIEGVTFAFDKGANASGNEPKYYDKGTSVRMYADNTLTISAETEISAVQFTFGSTTTAGLTASEGTLSDNAWSGNSKSIVFTTGSTGQQHIMNIVVTVGGGVTYSAYATTCSGEAPEPVYYSIRFFSNGAQIGETQTVLKGQQAEVPEDPTPLCDDYTFAGWWNAELAADNKEAKTWITDFKATKDQDYYAIYSRTEESEGEVSVTNTYTFTSNKWEESTNTWTGTTNGNQYTSGQGVQVTAKTTGAGAKTTQSFSNVTNVVVNYCTNAKSGAGSIDVTIGSTKVSHDVTSDGGTTLRDLEFEFSNVSGTAALTVNCTTNSIYVNSIAITSDGGVSSTTYYTSTLNCSGSAIENTAVEQKAVKMIYNGQVVIVRDGVRYNMLGQTIE